MNVATMIDAPQEVAPDRSEAAVFRMFAAATLIVIFTQKLALSFGGGSLMLSLPIVLALLGFSLVSGTAFIEARRLAIFGIFMLTLVVSSMLTGREFGALSILLVLVTYSAWLIVIPVSQETYLRCMKLFVGCTVFSAAMVFLQQFFQLLELHGVPNLELVIPGFLKQTGYNYLQPYAYLSPNIKPNGVFFLEASFISQFLALGLIIELALFRRIAVAALLGIAMLLTYAGTGFVIVAACLPLLAFRVSTKLLVAGLVGVLVAGAVAFATGWWETIAPRLTEVSSSGSSGYYRFNLPLQIAFARLDDPMAIVTGLGAGSTYAGVAVPVNYMPVAKLLIEYGFLPTILYYVFSTVCLFNRTGDKLVSWAFFVFLNTGGGYLATPVAVLACGLVCACLRKQATPPEPLQL